MKHRTKEAIEIINKIAKFNGSTAEPLSSDTLIFVNKETMNNYLSSEKICTKEQAQDLNTSQDTDFSVDTETKVETTPSAPKEEKMLDNIKAMMTTFRAMTLVIIISRTFCRYNWLTGAFTI